MIAYTDEPLSEATDKALRIWLEKPERVTLEKVVLSKVKRHECDALRDMVSAKDFDALLVNSQESMRQARRWQLFLECLIELKSEKMPFHTVKLT